MNRNDLAKALEQRIRDELREIQTWLPRPHILHSLPAERLPAAFIVLEEQDADPEPRPKWTLQATVLVAAAGSGEAGPRPVLNELVDGIETALQRRKGEGAAVGPGYWTTLGDTVYAVRPLHAELSIPMAGNVEGDRGVAVVDLEIIAPG